MKWSHVASARHILTREQGAIVKDWGGKLPIALVYPNTYHVGMSSLGFHAVYRLFNGYADLVCERAFWQSRFDPDDPVLSVESQRGIADFRVIAFSVSYEMDYPHLVGVLRQAGVPIRAGERDEDWPVVIAGGAAVSANPLPVADFCDAIVVGEAEEVIGPLAEALRACVREPRDALWRALARVPGVYVPHLSPGPPQTVQRQWVRVLDDYPTSTVIHTPDTEFGGIHLIEVSRGCGRGCRFCMAGYTTRPKREHSVDSILEQARRGLAWCDGIGLVGAAVSDYTQIDVLADRLRRMDARLTVSSLRVDPLSEPLLRALAESGAKTLTMAPEAGSERLRQIVNKGITEADLLHAAERAAHYRFQQLRLYFMLGLPTETDEDADAIADLCEAAASRFRGRLTANVTPFVPKAHTPFQWMEMAPRQALQARLRRLERRLGRAGIRVKSESPRWTAVQGVLARGDRRLGDVLASLRDTSLGAWQRAMDAHGLDAETYLRSRALDEPLPWSFIQGGPSAAFLRREWERAQRGAPTVPCPPRGCSQCAVCSDDDR